MHRSDPRNGLELDDCYLFHQQIHTISHVERQTAIRDGKRQLGFIAQALEAELLTKACKKGISARLCALCG